MLYYHFRRRRLNLDCLLLLLPTNHIGSGWIRGREYLSFKSAHALLSFSALICPCSKSTQNTLSAFSDGKINDGDVWRFNTILAANMLSDQVETGLIDKKPVL